MPEAKSQIGGWGGRRKGAGRKAELALSDRRKIASDYHARMQKIRDLGNTPCREAAIRKLMAEYGATHRMVERCLAEFLPAIRLYLYATKGADATTRRWRRRAEARKAVYSTATAVI